MSHIIQLLYNVSHYNVWICLYSRYEYRLTKEYNWNVKNKASKGYEVLYMTGI